LLRIFTVVPLTSTRKISLREISMYYSRFLGQISMECRLEEEEEKRLLEEILSIPDTTKSDNFEQCFTKHFHYVSVKNRLNQLNSLLANRTREITNEIITYPVLMINRERNTTWVWRRHLAPLMEKNIFSDINRYFFICLKFIITPPFFFVFFKKKKKLHLIFLIGSYHQTNLPR
jgi:hypothetical protein